MGQGIRYVAEKPELMPTVARWLFHQFGLMNSDASAWEGAQRMKTHRVWTILRGLSVSALLLLVATAARSALTIGFFCSPYTSSFVEGGYYRPAALSMANTGVVSVCTYSWSGGSTGDYVGVWYKGVVGNAVSLNGHSLAFGGSGSKEEVGNALTGPSQGDSHFVAIFRSSGAAADQQFHDYFSNGTGSPPHQDYGVLRWKYGTGPDKPAYPVLFVHGLGGSFDGTWGESLHALRGRGWSFGGAPTVVRGVDGTFSVKRVVRGCPVRAAGGACALPEYLPDLEFGVEETNSDVIPKADFYAMEFSHKENLSFEEQGWELKMVIEAIKLAWSQPTTGKVIVVAHSMGGVAARAYLQDYAVYLHGGGRLRWRDDVHQLITVGTPHQGSAVARRCQEWLLAEPVCELLGPNDVYSEAVTSIRDDSPEIEKLNLGTKTLGHVLPTSVAYSSLIVTGFDPLHTGDGDGIVEEASQNLASILGEADGRLHVPDKFSLSTFDLYDCITAFFTSFVQVVHQCEGQSSTVLGKILGHLALGTEFPRVRTLAGTSLTANAARLNAILDSHFGGDVWFEWGPTQQLENKTPKQTLNPSASSTTFWFALSGLAPRGTYFFRAAAENASGTHYGTPLTFTLPAANSPVLDAPLRVAPDPAVAQGPAPRFVWSKVSGAISYQVMVAESRGDLPVDPASVTCVNCVINAQASSTVFDSPVALAAGKRYYWQVKAKTPSFGYWSTDGPGAFNVARPSSAPLPAPDLALPSNGSTGFASSVSFLWSSVPTATSYRVAVATTIVALPSLATSAHCNPPGCIVNDTSYTTTYLAAESFAPNTTYYWRVKARSPDAFGMWSPINSFSTGATTAGDTSPPSGGNLSAIAGERQVFLSWGAFIDRGGSGVVAYRLVYATGSTPANCDAGIALLSSADTTFLHTGLANGTTYYYRVCAVDRANNVSPGVETNATPTGITQTSGNGSLRISIVPTSAAIAGAQWRVGSSGVWRNSDETIADLATGTHTIEFKPIPNWTTPANQSVVINANSLAWFDANPYVLISGGVAAASDLQAVANSDGSISLTWMDNATNEDSYTIEYSTSAAGPFQPVVSGMLPNTRSWTIGASAFSLGQAYCFRIRGYQDATALLSYSSVVCATPNVTGIGSINLLPMVSAGGDFQIALKSDGSLWSWGAGNYQQTGYEATGERSYPGPVLLSEVVAVSSGRFHTLAIKPDGRVFAWGGNFNGELGDGTTQHSAPKQVPGLSGIRAVAAGYSHSLAVGYDGSVWAWGSNVHGELGAASGGRLSAAQISGLGGVASACAGEYVSVATKADGSVWAWGRNNHGEAGVYGGQDQYNPQRIGGYDPATGADFPMTGAVSAACGQFHNLVLKDDGTIWAWGDGNFGVLGRAQFSAVTTAAIKADNLTDVVAVAAGRNHSLALKADGTVWAWGHNAAAQLGLGSTMPASSAVPVQVPGLSRIVAIAAAANYSVAVKGDGTVYTWGTGSFGALGSGVEFSASPVAVLGSTGSGAFHAFPVARAIVRLSPVSITFPATSLGSTSSGQAVTVSNLGSASVAIYGIDVSGDFTETSSCGTVVLPGNTCESHVAYMPTGVGQNLGDLRISHSAGVNSVSLSGVGSSSSHSLTVNEPVSVGGEAFGGGSYLHDSIATVTAVSNPGYRFAAWMENGSSISTSPAYSFAVVGDRTLTATFVQESGLALSFVNAGGGLVTSDPPGIHCAPDCFEAFPDGTRATLSVNAAPGHTFSGWGGACTGMGTCTLTVSGTTAVTAMFTANQTSNPPRLANISTRMAVLTGDNVLIGGFIIGGSTPKTVVVRARGPSLAAHGVPNVLANPVLNLYSGQTLIASNDDWHTAANAATIQASGFAPTDVRESAIVAALNPGSYTAIVTGAGGTSEVGIIEVFEVDAFTTPLINISTRGAVLGGDNVMIGGFIIQGSGPQTVVVRARGPSLAAHGVPNVLVNPTLNLYSGQTIIASNDDWQAASNASKLQSSGLAPSDLRESAIYITLNPGAYTAVVQGVEGTTGIGIVEVFAVP